jgi:hypothetical protein
VTGNERATWGRIGGLTTESRYGGHAMTSAARRGFLGRFLAEVDPECHLDPVERNRRAEAARRAHMLRLAAESARTRAARRAQKDGPAR